MRVEVPIRVNMVLNGCGQTQSLLYEVREATDLLTLYKY